MKLREKVFSDARARNHTQTPRYGVLFGVGDFVFIPSLEQKVEDTQAKVAGLQKELEQLKVTEAAAAKAQDERARRQVEIEKRSIEAKLKAEQLRQQALEEERRKREQEEREQKEQQTRLARQKKAEEEKMTVLKQEVEQKRKSLGGLTGASLSPEATLTEMLAIDQKIEEIKKAFHKELTDGINRSIQGFNAKFDSLRNPKKDESNRRKNLGTG
jgi:DNA repair exonuclease SbcCD ATPase subunit